MRNTTALRRRVLARRKCKPLEAVAVTWDMAMTCSMVMLFIIGVLVEGVTPHHSTVPADMANAKNVVSMPDARREDAIRIIISRDGAVYFGHRQTDVRDIADQIRESVRGGSERRAYLKVDRQAKYGDVEAVVDAIRGGGIWRIGLMAEQDRSAAALR
jgi:biopolymer transport protein TolR